MSDFPADCAARYRAVSQLAQGGFGTVWRAVQIDLDRPVAIKLLGGHAAGGLEALARFRREARVTASLVHPHIVRVLDHGAESGQAWMALEFLECATLRARLEQGPVPLVEALEIAAQIADALAAAHASGVLHRDVKPENVLRASEHVYKVTDFGIATFADSTGSIDTASGLLLGTPAYLAPERIEGADASPESDLYALGCVLYELLTGHLPFEAPGLQSLLALHLGEPPSPPSAHTAGLPPAVDRLVLALLSKKPQDRPQAADEVRDALRNLARTAAAPGAPRSRPARAGVTTVAIPAASSAPHAPRRSGTRAGLLRVFALACATSLTTALAVFYALGPARRTVVSGPPVASPTPAAPVTPGPAAPFPGSTAADPWLGTPLHPFHVQITQLLAARKERNREAEAWVHKLLMIGGSSDAAGLMNPINKDEEAEVIRHAQSLVKLEEAELASLAEITRRIAEHCPPVGAAECETLQATARGFVFSAWVQVALKRSRIARIQGQSKRDHVFELTEGVPFRDLDDGAAKLRAFLELAQRVTMRFPQRPAPVPHAYVRFLSQAHSVAYSTGHSIRHSVENTPLLYTAAPLIDALAVAAADHEEAGLVADFFRLECGRYQRGGTPEPMADTDRKRMLASLSQRVSALRPRVGPSAELDQLCEKLTGAIRR